jgi:glycosyltransferase involved in cell wall biosynthesis
MGAPALAPLSVALAEDGKTMKTAIVHYWLTGRRGGEKVIDALAELYPAASLFSHVCTPEEARRYAAHPLHTSFIQHLPFAAAWYRSYLPLMPLALHWLDLRGHDLIISSEAGPAKGFRKPPGALHLCYCHTPMRYLWDQHEEYQRRLDPFRRLAFGCLRGWLQRWDLRTAAGVDQFVANSAFVAARIRRIYGRDAIVIHPPVDVEFFGAGQRQPEAFYLLAGQLTGYKRPDLAIAAFRDSGRRLVVAGAGEELGRLRRQATNNIEFLGRVSDAELRQLYSRCRALVFPGIEDFGMIPVEAQAAGAPVIAFGAGGALETVIDGRTGLFFHEPTVAALQAALAQFEAMPPFDPDACRQQAAQFAPEYFKKAFANVVLAAQAARKKPE